MKHDVQFDEEYADEELCVAKSFSLKRKLVNGIRARAAYLGMPMSNYVATLIHNDLVRGIDAPFSLDSGEVPINIEDYKNAKPPPRGVMVEFDLPDV
jgi:hypothetical protein